jgi:CheY-like chemotaxis protein
MHFPDLSLPPTLIVDDCDDDVFVLRRRLREGGMSNPIITFASSGSALDFLSRRRPPELAPAWVFTEIKMERGDGFMLIDRLRANVRWKNLRIVIVTASNHALDVERALDARVDGYLVKFPSSDLLTEFMIKGPRFAVPKRTDSFSRPLCA